MPTITIQGHRHTYAEDEVITFAEGLVGLPQIKEAVVVPMTDLAPFCWLMPLDNDGTRFVVVNPHEIFDGYEPGRYRQLADDVQSYAIVTISSDWTRTTVNLRAPIVIDTKTRSGSQQILTDSPYHFAESIPQD